MAKVGQRGHSEGHRSVTGAAAISEPLRERAEWDRQRNGPASLGRSADSSQRVVALN